VCVCALVENSCLELCVCAYRRGTLVSFFARGSWDSQSVCVEFIALTSSSKRERENR
jgi:hypothetical protein